MTYAAGVEDQIRQMPHEPLDPRCGFSDGYRQSFLVTLVMGTICNTCRTLGVNPGSFFAASPESPTGDDRG